MREKHFYCQRRAKRYFMLREERHLNHEGVMYDINEEPCLDVAGFPVVDAFSGRGRRV